jgi:hypothetical protein
MLHYDGFNKCKGKLTEDIVTWNGDREAELQAKDRLTRTSYEQIVQCTAKVIQRSYLDEEGESDAIGILAASLNLIVMTNKMPDKIFG